jgi:hypothetical protein
VSKRPAERNSSQASVTRLAIALSAHLTLPACDPDATWTRRRHNAGACGTAKTFGSEALENTANLQGFAQPRTPPPKRTTGLEPATFGREGF